MTVTFGGRGGGGAGGGRVVRRAHIVVLPGASGTWLNPGSSYERASIFPSVGEETARVLRDLGLDCRVGDSVVVST